MSGIPGRGRQLGAGSLPSLPVSRVFCPPDPSFLEVLAVSLINEALDQGSPEKTLSALLLPSAGLDDISLPVGPRYHLLLVAAKRQKAQVRSSAQSGLSPSPEQEGPPLWVERCPGCTLGEPRVRRQSLLRGRPGGTLQEGGRRAGPRPKL